MNQKCPTCGLINWPDAPECKRCKAPFEPLEEADAIGWPMPVFEEEKPATALGVLMIIWGLLTLAGGLYLLSFGAVSHVLVVGPAILISGVSLMRGRPSVMALYFLGLVVMLVWVCAEGRVVLGIGSFLYAGLIGLLVTKRRLPVLAGILIGFSCLAMIAAIILPTVMRPGKAAWRNFQPAEGMFTVQMPSEPVARETKVEQMDAYTLTRHPYESRVWRQGAATYEVVDIFPALPLSDSSSYDRFLSAELAHVLHTTDSTLIFKNELAFHGYQGLMFEAKPPGNLFLERPRCVGRIFMSSDHLYVMHMTGDGSSELMSYNSYFLNPVPSFQSDLSQDQR